MEDIISRFYKKHWKKNPLVVILQTGFIFIIVLVILWLIHKFSSPGSLDCPKGEEFLGVLWEIAINLVASIIAFIAAFQIVFAISKNFQKNEDEIKASYLNSNLQEQYSPKGVNENGYRKSFHLHDKSGRFIVYVNDLYRQYKDTNHLYFSDDADKHFELELYIMMHIGILYGAHSASKTVSELTVRLNDFQDDKNKDKKAVAYTTRSTYLAHLLTNRAIDYPLEEELTVRKIYENTKYLTPLNRSKLSNHIGVNALIFLAGDILVLPRRGKDATVAKNGVTASIATRLNLDAYKECFSGTEKLVDEKTISSVCVLDKLTSLLIDKQYELEMKEVMKAKMHFLGLSRDPYEGGKPTLFYYIDLEMTKEEFLTKLDPYYQPEGIDAVHELLFVPWKNVGITSWEEKIQKRDADQKKAPLTDSERLIMEDKEYDKSRLLLINPDHYKYSKKEKRYTFITDEKEHQFIFEQNLIANLWFYVNKDKTDNEIQSQLY